MRSAVAAFWTDESGVTAIEYGLIAGLVALLLVLSLTSIGDSLGRVFNRIASCLGTSGEGGC